MFMLDVDYPSLDEEVEIVRSTTGSKPEELQKILNPESLIELPISGS